MDGHGSTAKPQQTLSIIWVAMTSGIGVYWIVHSLMAGRTGGEAWSPAISNLFMGAAIAAYVMALWWYQMTIGRWAAAASSSTALAKLSEADLARLPQHLQAALIVCFALVETPAVIGLVHSFLPSIYPHLFECLAATSLIAMGFLRAAAMPGLFALLDRLERPSGSTV